MHPQISVIVPVYKAEKYLHRCIDSILTQTFTDFELILVDDGSPDGSGAICDEYAHKDKRVKVIHKENGGVSSARNAGLDIARGNIICFVDSDDWVENKFLDSFCKKDADIVVQAYYQNIIKETINKEYYISIEDKYFECVDEFLKTLYMTDNFGYLPTKALKKEIIDKYNLRLNCNYKFREDLEFVLRYISKCKTFATINKATYHYIIPYNPQKYDNIDPESNFLCTYSIIENYRAYAKVPIDFLVLNTNSLSSSIFKMYKSYTLKIDKINNYVKMFCKHYELCDNNKKLSKKSRFIYYIVGTHTPSILHKLIRYFIKKSY